MSLPAGLTPEDEIAVEWERDEISTKVTVSLGEATITVEASRDGAELVPWLVASLGTVLEHVMDAIEKEDEEAEHG